MADLTTDILSIYETCPQDLDSYLSKLNGTQIAEAAKQLEITAEEPTLDKIINIMADHIHRQINAVDVEQQSTFIRQYFAAYVSDSEATVASQTELDLIQQRPRAKINPNPSAINKKPTKKDKPAASAAVPPAAAMETVAMAVESITDDIATLDLSTSAPKSPSPPNTSTLDASTLAAVAAPQPAVVKKARARKAKAPAVNVATPPGTQ